MKVLVTGAGGFLGRNVVERLLARGVSDVRCLVRREASREDIDAIAARYPEAKVDVVVGNLLDKKLSADIIKGTRVVCHLAASLKGSPADMFLNTVVTSNNLLEAVCKRKTLKVVLVSSFGVYGVSELPGGTIVDERTPLEPHPEKRDAYSHAKWRQEKLFREYQEAHDFPLVIMRPGVIYGPGGAPFSARVGLSLFGWFLHLGGGNQLPLTYVENCADAIALAALDNRAVGEAFNICDDDLPTSREYLRRYRREVEGIRFVPIPYAGMQLISRAVEKYHAYSKGQLPAIFTPYKTENIWKGMRFDNSKLKALGWQPLVGTDEGLRRAFKHLRNGGRK